MESGREALQPVAHVIVDEGPQSGCRQGNRCLHDGVTHDAETTALTRTADQLPRQGGWIAQRVEGTPLVARKAIDGELVAIRVARRRAASLRGSQAIAAAQGRR